MDDFTRINQPRVETILKTIKMIETSARSNSAEERMGELLAPVRAKLASDSNDSQEARKPSGMTRARMDFSIACSKADRARRACEKMVDELTTLINSIPDELEEPTP